VVTASMERLDLACGQRKEPGFFGIDVSSDGEADLVHDLLDFPWPVESDSVSEVVCNHFVEHIPHWLPGWDRDGWWLFFDELYRVMRVDATATFTHPHCMSTRAFWDPTHTRYIADMSWYYTDAAWRKEHGLDHYPVAADFHVVTIDGIGIDQSFMGRNAEYQAVARTNYWNQIPDLRVILKKKDARRPPPDQKPVSAQ
jgi:hypothetical protein